MPAFQVRSLQRDKKTDRERINSIVGAVDAAIASAEKEKSLLTLRVENARDLAAFATGNDSDEYLSRGRKIRRGLLIMSSSLSPVTRELDNWTLKSLV
jgi:hypothetical protein